MASSRPRSSRSTVIGAVATVVGVLLAVPGTWLAVRALAPELFQPPVPEPVACPQYLGESHEILSENPDSPPKDVTYSVTPSAAFPGRVKISFGWLHDTGVYRAAIAVSGVYGHSSSGDTFVAHAQRDASTGDCWNWYSMIHRNAAQPESIQTVVDGLWGNQQYCFYATYQANSTSEWSQPTQIECFETTWRSKWGTPEYPD